MTQKLNSLFRAVLNSLVKSLDRKTRPFFDLSKSDQVEACIEIFIWLK